MIQKTIPMLLSLITLLLMGSGCIPQFVGNQVLPELEPGDVLFSDDFSETPSGWGIWDREDALVDYYAEGLRIQVNKPYFDFWSVAGKQFGNVQIEVDAVKFSGPDDNDFGILCRYQNKENFYLFVISSDGYYGIAKLSGGQYSMIGSDKLQYSQSITQGQAVNRLRVDCIDERLALYVNGKKLIEGIDADFQSGDVGLIAGAYQAEGVEILFDNFVVKKPGD